MSAKPAARLLKKQFLGKLQALLAFSRQAKFEAQTKKMLCDLDLRFGLNTSDFYQESKPIVTYLREKLAAYNDGCGLGILEFPLVVALYAFMRAVKPRTVIETGTASGASTYAILSAFRLNDNGAKLTSIDLPQEKFGATNHPGDLTEVRPKETGWLVKEGIRDLANWELLLGDSHDLLAKRLHAAQSIDVFIHDSEHTEETMRFEFETAWPHIKPQGYLLSDDLHLTRAFQNFCLEHALANIETGRFGFARKNNFPLHPTVDSE